MLPVAVGVEQTDGDRLHAQAFELADSSECLGLVECLIFGTIRQRPLRDPECEVTRNERHGEFDLRIEHVVAMLVANDENITESFRDEQRDLRPLALDQYVGDDGRGVHEQVRYRRRLDAGLAEHLTHRRQRTVEQITVGGERLVDPDLAFGGPQHGVRERAADVDRDAKCPRHSASEVVRIDGQNARPRHGIRRPQRYVRKGTRRDIR